MAITPYTEEDKKLLACLPKCQEQLSLNISYSVYLCLLSHKKNIEHTIFLLINKNNATDFLSPSFS